MSRSKSPRTPPQRRSNPWWLWGLLLAAAATAAFVLWRGTGSTAATGAPSEITVGEAATRYEAGAFILDVREPDEWQAVHIPGATLIPLGQLATRVNEVPRDQAIVVVCRSGNRSQVGRDILLAAGFTQVTSMAGGLTQWQAQGYPTVSGP